MTIPETFADHSAVATRAALELPPLLERAASALFECLRTGGKILACGNGGSAADAQHVVAELVGRFREERRALAAIALTGDSATLTALGNDYGFERVFARQVEALARPGDVLLAISTSGNSPNVVRAAQAARDVELVGQQHEARVGRVPVERVALPREDAHRVGEQQPLGPQAASVVP